MSRSINVVLVLLLATQVSAQIKVNPNHTCYHDYWLDRPLKCNCVIINDSLKIKLRDHTALHYRIGEVLRDTIYVQDGNVVQDQQMWTTRGKLIQAFRYIEDETYVATNYWSTVLRYIKVDTDDIYNSTHWVVKQDSRGIVTDSIFYEYDIKTIHKQFHPNGKLMAEHVKNSQGKWAVTEYSRSGKKRGTHME